MLANGSSRDRQGPHKCTLAAHEDRKETFVNSVEAENPEAFQHHAFFLLRKLEKSHVYYSRILQNTLTPNHASYSLHYSGNKNAQVKCLSNFVRNLDAGVKLRQYSRFHKAIFSFLNRLVLFLSSLDLFFPPLLIFPRAKIFP